MARDPDIEAFRDRLKKPKKEKSINWQQWIGSPTAWLALLLSASSFFYTFLYHSDELSVVMDNPTITPAGEEFVITPPPSMTFINSGSRPVAITSAIAILVQNHPHTVECEERRELTTEIPLVFEQTVVKPYDAVARVMKFEKPTMSFKKAAIFTGQSAVLICVRFQLAATDAARWQKTVSLGLQISVPRRDDVPLRQARFDTRPKYLMKRNRFWTEIDRDARRVGL